MGADCILNTFAVFILTHKRADTCITHRTLRNQGYTGKIYFVVDDKDPQISKYEANFGKDNILIFSKEITKSYTDCMDNFGKWSTITYPRNASFDLAEKVGIKYFIQLDDDYNAFNYVFQASGKKYELPIQNLDRVFEILLLYYKANRSILTLTIAQGGDFIGGIDSVIFSGRRLNNRFRKAMNSFICSTDRRFAFIGTMNEDVNTYTSLGRVGKIFLTFYGCILRQSVTQSLDGGITELYKDVGTYVKSFYTVIQNPSSVTIRVLGHIYPRLHHFINWDNTVPKIISKV